MIAAVRRTRLVIFDLWKTLVPLSDDVKRRAFLETASALRMNPVELAPVWAETRVLRETVDLRRYFAVLGPLLGRAWSTDEVSLAMAARRRNHVVGFQEPMHDAEECLRAIRDAGLKIGVVSNGSSDVAEMLESSPLAAYLDVIVVSGVFGSMKPGQAIYKAVAHALAIPLELSVYVGDGQDSELEGAQRAGCRAVLIERGSPTEWTGESIESLLSVPQLLTDELVAKENR